jgi:hypothetical protein
VYGPVRTVVWQGTAGDRRPYADHRSVARLTAATANPDLPVASVVRLFEAPSVTDDGPLAAKRAESRELPQRNLGHPESVWSSGSGSAIKNHGWREFRLTMANHWGETGGTLASME